MIKVEVACLPIFLFVWGYFLLCATYLYFKVWIEGLIWKSILFEFQYKNNCLCGKRCGKADVPGGISEAPLFGSGFRFLWMAKERQRENSILLFSEEWARTAGVCRSVGELEQWKWDVMVIYDHYDRSERFHEADPWPDAAGIPCASTVKCILVTPLWVFPMSWFPPRAPLSCGWILIWLASIINNSTSGLSINSSSNRYQTPLSRQR